MILESLQEFTRKHKGEYYDSRWRTLEPHAFNKFWKFYKDKLAAINDGKKKADHIKEATESYLKSQYADYIGAVLPRLALEAKRKELAHIPVVDQVPAIMEAATGHSPSDQLDCKVLQHWLWQVKRKMWDLPVINHIFIMLYEKDGGSGKTTLLKKMLSPLADYTLHWDMGQLQDNWNRNQLAENFIVLWDEMAKPEKTSADTLKHQITATINDNRGMHGQTGFRYKQNCSFIGAANKPLDALIVDNTGMRRFWQIVCQHRMDWEAVNAIDAVALWQSIDENLEAGYITEKILKDVQAKQCELATADSVESFVTEMCLVPSDVLDALECPIANLYDHYRSWAVRNGYTHILANNIFGKHLRAYVTPHRKTAGVIFYISRNHRLNEYNGNIDDIIGNGGLDA